MTMKTKEEIFKEHLQVWLKAKGDRKKRGEIAAHIVFVTNCHPKSVSRTFKRLQMRDPAHQERRGRPRYYDSGVIAALRDVWEAGDRACGELLHPIIGEYVAALQRDGQWKHGDEATAKLFAMSERTTKRRVTMLREENGVRRRGISATSPSILKHIIPI